MKIMIVTPFDSANFGAFLQAFCLKKFLEECGHYVVHCKTRDDDFVRKLYYLDKPRNIKQKIFHRYFESNRTYGKKKYEIFLKAHEVFNIEDINMGNFDLVILGSDEIWNIKRTNFLDLKFWGSNYSNVIAYAPSIGNASLDLFEKYQEINYSIKNMLKIFPRDLNTQSVVKAITKKDTELVCDPTMLLPVNSYYVDFPIKYLQENPCLLIYAYTLDAKSIIKIKTYARKKGLKIVSCCFNHQWTDYQIQCGPLEFSSVIKQSKEVFTTTFHGSMYCILNHANFVTMSNNSKTVFLLEQLGLHDRNINMSDLSCGLLNRLFDDKIIYDSVDSKILTFREKSAELLCHSIDDINNKQIKYEICPAEKCTGCFACLNSCSKNAISVLTDSKGITRPCIDRNLCVNCGLCSKICPVNNSPMSSKPLKCFAAQRTDQVEKDKSASGGIGAALSEWVIKQDGVVYGAVANPEGDVKHYRATSKEEIDRFRCSKYSQSQIDNIFKFVKKDIQNGTVTLFTGTPCQVAGLKNYLGNLANSPYLFMVDIVCHGVPPKIYLEQHLRKIASGDAFDNFSFRGGKDDFRLKVYNGDKIIYDKDKNLDTYYFSFLKSYIYRENCYECPFANDKRCSDLTIGDFWGLDRSNLKTNQIGKISLILVNTTKGQELLSHIENSLIIEERQVQEAIQGNPQLREPAKKTKFYNLFIQSFQKNQNFDLSINLPGLKRKMIVEYLKNIKIYRKMVRTIKGKR